MTKTEEIQITNDELNLIVKEKLTPKQIYLRRARIQKEMGKLSAMNIQAEGVVKHNDILIEKLSRQKGLLHSDQVEDYLKLEKMNEQLAKQKADQMLLSYIGKEAYDQLKAGRSIKFIAKDNVNYILKPDGTVGRKSGVNYVKICVIKPHSLPLSDRIIAILTSVKENPKKYPSLKTVLKHKGVK